MIFLQQLLFKENHTASSGFDIFEKYNHPVKKVTAICCVPFC
jgi:hypothetical protein